MLVVETYLAPDAFGGNGLFCKNFVKKGTVIWQYNAACDRFYTIEEYRNLPLLFAKIVDHHGYPGTIDGVHGFVLGLDNDRFINHSDKPNVTYEYSASLPVTDKADDRSYVCIATEDLQPGTQITYDYYTFLNVPEGVYDGLPTGLDFLTKKEKIAS